MSKLVPVSYMAKLMSTNKSVPVSVPTPVTVPIPKSLQHYKYLLILDFEATCDGNDKSFKQFEIIEFPIVMLNTSTLQIEHIFHNYCKPTLNPVLRPFCTELTGITQEMVNGAKTFPEVWQAAKDFLKSHKLFNDLGEESFCFLTCGDWDLLRMLPNQFKNLKWSKNTIPPPFTKWINIKKSYADCFPHLRGGGMAEMLSDLKIKLDGRHHSGIDDCKNITKIACHMINLGYVFQATTKN